MENNGRKLKICHIITRMIVGGAQENTLLTIIGHIKKGHDVTLITGPSPGPEGKLLERSDYPEFEIIELPSLVRELNPLKDWQAVKALKKLFRERKFDVVHTHSSKAGVVGRAAAWKAKVPFVCHTVHGQAFHAYETPLKNFIYKASERWAAKRCHKIYAVAQAMIDQCVEANVAPREKYKVVYSGMEIERFLNSKPEPELREQLGIPADAIVLGTVARLFPLKGYEYIIPAAEKICKQHPKVHFLIIGNGPMKDEMDADIAKLGLTEHFHFSGLVPPDQVYRYIALMDMLLHLSLREGLPRSVVQSLASGKPAIGFELDGTPEVITNGETGFVVTPKSIPEVEAAVLKLLDDPELRHKCGEQGREKVAEQFSWQRMADVLEKEYLKYT
jgi:glycosyltransferase involved in cell wall biosynthesis